MPGDDATYRTTVLVRNGSALGTGTIIASVEGESLILTAAHVVEGPGPLRVEVYRYNLGWERTGSLRGFPRRLPAIVATRDRPTDLAILRVSGQLKLPYVARIAPIDQPISRGTAVTSIGFDRGESLIGFDTRVRGFDQVEMHPKGGDRDFLITENPPEVGRSGGGLFLKDGSLAGVCLARAQVKPGRTLGIFSTVGNIRELLDSDKSLGLVVARSRPVIPATKSASPPASTLDNRRIDRTVDRLRAN